MMGLNSIDRPFKNNGERIYFTGASISGDRITFTGGNTHLQMMGGGCATCHGVDRGGRRMMPKFWKTAPEVTAAALFDSRDDDHGDGHGDHAAYDEQSLRRAVFEGIDPAGAPLMTQVLGLPRYAMC